MSGDLEVREITGTGRELQQFIRFPWRIYRGLYPHPNWVPPLLSAEKALLDKSRSPFFEHGDAAYFMAFLEGRPVGRIAGIVNDLHVEFQREEAGFFGFFETVQDQAVTDALVGRAADWVRERGLKTMRGPMNFSTNETCGLLVDGFDEPPTIMMTYNPPWYETQLLTAGLEPVKLLLSYFIQADSDIERIIRIARKAQEKAGVEMRALDMSRFEEEVDLVKGIYNEAWERNWGFVPMTDAEFDHLAKDLKPVVDPDFVKIASIEGEPVGFSLTVPDVNQVLIDMNGRLFPFGWIRLLLGLKRIDVARVIALGVKKEYQGIGLGSMFYADAFDVARRKGYRGGEASWILEDNTDMRKPMEAMSAEVNKRYRVYDLAL
ncbi:MAG: GNAT family N-acetyltransferase [bacterium]